MKKFKWKMDRSVVKGDQSEDVNDADIFIGYLHGAFQSAFKDGLSREYMRRAFKIAEKVESSKDGMIELEDAEFGLIDDAFTRAKFNPRISKMVIQIYDALETAKIEK